jgi:hypothetical protein
MVEVSHTSENLAEVIKGMLTIVGYPNYTNQYNFLKLKGICTAFIIPMSKIVAVVTDNAANIVKAMKEILKLKHIQSFAHTLSLAVKSAIHSDEQFSELSAFDM